MSLLRYNLVLLILISASPGVLHAQSFTPLGDLPGGDFSSLAYDVSADGAVVVGGSSPGGSGGAFRWENGVMANLGDHQGLGSNAIGVSGDGSIVAGISAIPGFDNVPVRWISGTLSLLPFSAGEFGEAGVSAISRDGTVIVGFLHDGLGDRQAAKWVNGAISTMPHLAGQVNSYAEDVSADGSVIVGRSGPIAFPQNQIRAVRWTDGGSNVESLHPVGWDGSAATGISEDGNVIIGWVTRSPSSSDVFRWENGSHTFLGAGRVSLQLGDVSADGSIIVGTDNTGVVIWDAVNGWRNLFTMLSAAGVDMKGWTRLSGPVSISDNGKVVVGNGSNPSGFLEAYRATLEELPETDIVVNDNRDLEDDNDADEVCDVDTDVSGNQCTLRAAIQEANRRNGATVTFNIPGGGVPKIEVVLVDDDQFIKPLPEFAAAITIDGTTQSGGWVELAGENQDIPGIVIGKGANGSIVRGMVINRFKGGGITVKADNCIIENNRVGTDPTGLFWRGNGEGLNSGLEVGGINVIASDNSIRNNVLAGNIEVVDERMVGGIELHISGHRNEVTGNRIGIGADGLVLQLPAWGPDDIEPLIGTTYGMLVWGDDNIIGAVNATSFPTECTSSCNILAGHMVEIDDFHWRDPSENSAEPGDRNIISGNYIGVDANKNAVYLPQHPSVNFTGQRGIVFGGIDIVITGNYLQKQTASIDFIGDSPLIRGNTIRGNPDEPVSGNFLDHHAVRLFGANHQIEENDIRSFSSRGLVLNGHGHTISNNEIHGNPLGGIIVVEGEGLSISGNNIHDNQLGGVILPSDWNGVGGNHGAIFSQNRIYRNEIGIDLGGEWENSQTIVGDGVTLNDGLDSDDGPNNFQNFPNIHTAVLNGTSLGLDGFFETPLFSTDSYTVEVFTSTACSESPLAMWGPWTYGQAEHFFTSFEVEANLGDATFRRIYDGDIPEGHHFVTLTATNPTEGVTSEFSRCLPMVGADRVASVDVESGQTGTVLTAQGVSVDIDAAGVLGKGLASVRSGNEAGSLFVTRFETEPDTSIYSGVTGTTADGSQVDAVAISPAYWSLTDRHLTVAGGAESNALLFTVCLDPNGRVLPGWTESVVVVQRNLATEGQWIPQNTEVAMVGGSSYLCASGLPALGEFSFGGVTEAFPEGSSVDVGTIGELPNSFDLSSAYPNPFNYRTELTLSMPEAGIATVEVFDIIGRRVAVLLEDQLAAGTHTVAFEAAGLTSGVYFIRAIGTEVVETRSVTLVR